MFFAIFAMPRTTHHQNGIRHEEKLEKLLLQEILEELLGDVQQVSLNNS